MANEKKKLRASIRDLTETLSEDYFRKSDAGIFENLSRMPEYRNARTIFVYWSMDREADTHAIINDALASGKTVTLPVCCAGGVMGARAIDSPEDLVPGMLGIPAPRDGLRDVERVEIDLILVPAVAFDDEGRRLGRGGGYYDRYLNGYGGVTVGLAREKLLCPAVPTETHDMRVQFVVTEERVIKAP